MKHITAIRKIVNEGQFVEAQKAIEDLLELGPHNSEALKLKAALYAHVGNFEAEDLTWRRMINSHNDDEDAIRYFQGQQIEDREHYYFTDPLPGGGRRYLAYPRSLISVSFVGLVGCLAFLMLTHSGANLLGQSTAIVLASFAALVLSPWVAIIYIYIRTLRYVCVSRVGLEIASHFKKHLYTWQEIDKLSVIYSDDLSSSDLHLMILPKLQSLPSMSIDLSDARSSVRARKHLLAEIKDYHLDVEHQPASQVRITTKALLRY